MTAILNDISEQFLVALVVPVTIQALSVLLIALLMDVMWQFQAVVTSTWPGSQGRYGFFQTSLTLNPFLFLLKKTLYWKKTRVFYITISVLCVNTLQAYWQPHNRAVARRIQNMGWRADGGLWLLVRGGGLYLSKGTGVSKLLIINYKM